MVFTSGATESVSQAICGTARFLKSKGRHLITSAVEHHAVLHTVEYLVNKEGFELTTLPVDAEGRVAPQHLDSAIRDDTILVSVMAANNETGAINLSPCLGKSVGSGVFFFTPMRCSGLVRNHLNLFINLTPTWLPSVGINFMGQREVALCS